MTRRIYFLLPVLLALTLLFAACGKAAPASTQSPTENPTSAPTATSTAVPGRLVYITSAPADSDPYVSLISDFAASSALQYLTATVLDASVLTPEVEIVVLQSAPSDLGASLDANPKVQFILLESSELTGKSNLSTVSARQEDLYFMAGYLSTLIADDWRSAGLMANDGSLGEKTAEAFLNGGRYVCGKCNPAFPPMVELPQVMTLAGSTSPTDWLAAANSMLVNGVNVMFVDAQAATAEVVSAVVSMKANLVGLTPPPAGSEANWAATVTSDASGVLKQVLETALKGQGGQAVTVQVTLADINAELVSPARQDRFNQIAAKVAVGEIGTLSIP